MKKILLAAMLLFSFSLVGCLQVKKIGEVNMISNRNIDNSVHYEKITTYSGGSKRQLRKSKANTIHDAVDQTVKMVPGGEYLMNAKLYIVNTGHFACEGDVWGIPVGEGDYQGYKLGEEVTWKAFWGWYRKGTIIAIKDSEKCVVKTKKGFTRTIKYDKLLRTKKD